ncbi:MAG: hypothetical protein NW237_16655 [Cyanobacteriota bacterium]|nr:hypothetical protein [Cyanobacteriota bacterium]
MNSTSQLDRVDARSTLNLPLFGVLGVLAWAIGVLFIRFAGGTFFVEGSPWLVGLYGLTIPGVWLLVKGLALATKLSGVEIVLAIVIMNATATLFDGVAIAWMPSLYDLPLSAHLLAAAYLLWFVGLTLWFSFGLSHSES